MDSAHAWRRYYRDERARLGPDALRALLERAESLGPVTGGAVVVPHTRLEVTGDQIARAVATVLASGAERVLAIGVLHGGRRSDRERVAAARAGDERSRALLRGVHDDDGIAAEEFSLDAFVALLESATERNGRSVEVVRRYPFLVGDDPFSLPGLDELQRLVEEGAMLVVTTDPIHHGHAYGTPAPDCLPADDPTTIATAQAMIDEQFAALSSHRFAEFTDLTERHRSDFRDTGPVMAALLGVGFDTAVHDLALVDYSAALDTPSPSWVAGALATTSPSRSV